MKVILDTSVWSLALRRNQVDEQSPYVQRLRILIIEDRVILLGAIRQEVLSGIRQDGQFHRLRGSLRAFPNLDLVSEDYELAAEFYNQCRAKGIQGSNTDFLICAVSSRHDHSILTNDGDFTFFAEHLPINLERI